MGTKTVRENSIDYMEAIWAQIHQVFLAERQLHFASQKLKDIIRAKEFQSILPE